MFLLFPLFLPGWTKAGLPDGKVWVRQPGISIKQKDLESENLVAVPAMPPMTVNLAQGLAHCKHSTNMSPISSSSSIFFPLPFYPLAHIRHTGLLSVCRTCYRYSCFKVSELALPSAGYVPPTDHPNGFLLTFSSHLKCHHQEQPSHTWSLSNIALMGFLYGSSHCL